MPNDDKLDPSSNPEEPEDSEPVESEPEAVAEAEADSSFDSSSDSEDEEEKPETKSTEPVDPNDYSAEGLYRKLRDALDSRAVKKSIEADQLQKENYRDPFDFPPDPENWQEEDLQEVWADAPLDFTKPGWDPVFADEDDWEVMRNEVRQGRDPPIAPIYVPYRKYYPAITDNHPDIKNAKSVIEELDRIEEFMKWVSYIFEDGSSYEGTVWDDLAHGKGVYIAEDGLVRYEGEWLQNQMEGHGVVEVDIPGVQPVPGSKLEEKMRAEGRIITRDFMSPEDKRWLEMDIEDSVRLSGGRREIPFYEREEWVKVFGRKPEKGRYRYAGQWKHGRMHGCGVYEVNEQMIFGRFYFGELLEDSTGCDSDVATLHAGIAEVAAAKARMFVNKPDGMIREKQGPYGDPQHPYLYEEDDVWMAPGFINQFYEVPDYWKTYVQEVDQEREMWLNSFYKAPLRIPMPAELEYWWSRRDEEDDPEFVLINKEPEPDPEDPSQLIYTEDPVILHTRTGRIINFVEDEKHGVCLFWQPDLKDGEDVDLENIEFLPLGFDEFYGKSKVEKKGLAGLVSALENSINSFLDKIQKWAKEKKEREEKNLELIDCELDYIEAEISLEEALEDVEMEMKMTQQEEERKAITEDKDDSSTSVDVGKGAAVEAREQRDEEEEEEDDDDDEDDEGAPMSFGTVSDGKSSGSASTDNKERKPGKAPFSALSLSLPSSILVSVVPPKLRESLLSSRRECCVGVEKKSFTSSDETSGFEEALHSVQFRRKINQHAILRAGQKPRLCQKAKKNYSWTNSLAKSLSAGCAWQSLDMGQRFDATDVSPSLGILSLHVPVPEVITLM